MNNRKNQNSILVLATLGVYLGLVLAGATPTVWAQVEVGTQRKSDSDNVDRLLAQVESSFSTLLKSLGACKKLPSNHSVNGDKWLSDDCAFSVEKGPFASGSSRSNEFALLASSLLDGLDAEHLKSLLKDGSDPFRSFELYGSGLRLNLVLTQDTSERADVLAELLDGHIKSKAFRATTFFQETLYKNSLAYVIADNQVFIVTRLPRGSLDLLLASDAK